MIKRKRLSLLLLIMLILSTAIPSFASSNENLPPGLERYDMRILHNGKYVKSNIVPKILKNDTVLAPLRFILESSDYKVDWNKNGMVTITKDDEKIVFNSRKSEYPMEKVKGTILIDLGFFKQFKDMTALYDNTAKTIVVKSKNLRDDEVFDYHLGERSIVDHNGRTIPYRLNGGITLPDKDSSPLVIVMHGAHHFDKSEFNRYDLGYSYLLRDLKEKGYAAMSINVGINYSFEDGEPSTYDRLNHLFEETLQEVIKANNGDKSNFDIDLKNKLDLNNIILIGHSRSGQEIYQLADRYKDDKRINIKGLLAIAPARGYVFDFSTVDIPTGIVLPSLDGDVDQLDGQSIFDILIDDENRKSESQVALLYGANHNGFNEAILNQDQGDTWFQGEKYKISPKEQRDFLKEYTGNFARTVFNGESLYDNIKSDKETLYGYKTLITSFVAGQRIYTAEDGIKGVSSNKAEFKAVVDSNMFGDDTAPFFEHPGNNNAFKLLNIKWKEKNSSISFEIKESPKNKEKLVFYIAQDSSDKLNNQEYQKFKITLVDKNNKESSIVSKDRETILKYVNGQNVYESTYTTHTPLGFLDVSLDEFKDIDKNNLKEVRLDFTEKDTGSLMLRHIQFN